MQWVSVFNLFFPLNRYRNPLILRVFCNKRSFTLDIAINTEGQFIAMTKMATRLWKKRSSLFEDGSGNIAHEELLEIEDQFSTVLAGIIKNTNNYLPIIDQCTQSKELLDREVAFLTLLLTGPKFWESLLPAIKDQGSNRYWQLCRMTSFIPKKIGREVR